MADYSSTALWCSCRRP